MILQRSRHITTSQSIRRRIKKRMDAWESERHGMLVEDTLRTYVQYPAADRIEESEEHRAKT